MKEMMNMPERKLIDHRGPMCVDVRGAWYFITVCAEGHREWVIDSVGRDDPIAPNGVFDYAAESLISTARHFQKIGKWKLALFLVMPDHIHFIVHIPECGASGAMGSSRPTGLAVCYRVRSRIR